MKRLVDLWMLAMVFCLASCGNDEVNAAEPVVDVAHRLRIVVGGQSLTAILYDNPTTRDFISRLPLTVNLSDYAGSEKIFTPSPGLTTNNSPSGMKPVAGDIALFVPWGNVAIFYEDGRTASNSLIPIGRIENGVNMLGGTGTIQEVRFEVTKVEP